MAGIDTGTSAIGGDGPLILDVLWPLNVLATAIVLARWYASAKLTRAMDWGLAWAALACVSQQSRTPADIAV